MVIRLGIGPAVSASDLRLLHRLPPTSLVRSRKAASAVGGSCRPLITVAVLLITQAWSWGRGNSPAARRTITIATLHHILINGAWAPGEGSADSPGRLPTGPTGGLLAVSWGLTDWWDPLPLGHIDKPSWVQDSILWC